MAYDIIPVGTIKMERYIDEVALLVAHGGPLDGQRWTLGKGITIGRGRNCDIIINDRQVSRQHALISINPKSITFSCISCNGIS